MIKLGTLVRDRVTGLEGIAYGRASFLFGCERIAIQPKVDGEGKVQDFFYVDEPQVEEIGEGVVLDQTPAQRNSGGPMPATPTRNSGPSTRN